MDENLKAANLKSLADAAEALKRNGFGAKVCADRAEAARHVLSLTGKGRRVGLGGSVTLEELDLPRRLQEAGQEVLTHRPGMDPARRAQACREAQAADFYLASPQAVTRDGKLIFVDGSGNRVSALLHGPGAAIVVAGRNKLVRDTEEGLWRMRNVAAVANNIRLKKKNPCVETGRCMDCSSPERICNAVVMLWKRPRALDFHVVLVDEELGY
ncbi:MAG: lactate utilization protein [Elusimicrobia bacterium]|nr:lactate utilization protein [Elusimicrobiota bacterium]